MVWSTENVDTLDVEFESAQLVKDKNTKHSGGMVEEDDSSDESSASSVVDSKQDHGSDEENDAPLDSFLATEINPHEIVSKPVPTLRIVTQAGKGLVCDLRQFSTPT